MFRLEVKGLAVNQQRARSIPKQARFAGVVAANATAFDVQRAFLQAIGRFDRPTPWVLKSIWVDRATKDKPEARIYPRNLGGKSVDPAKVLHAEVFGGARRLKRSERAFQRIGILPAGFAMVPARGVADDPQTGDGYGGVKGSFLVRLLAYFEAFGEVGYRANMKPAGRRRLARKGNPRMGPPRRFKHIAGVEYFVSYGRLRSRNPNSDAEQHLAAGIWSRRGTHGSDVKPVFLFVRAPRYRVRLPLPTIFNDTVRQRFPSHYSAALTRALSTAR
jgi:hypothetical protein